MEEAFPDALRVEMRGRMRRRHHAQVVLAQDGGEVPGVEVHVRVTPAGLARLVEQVQAARRRAS